MLSGMYNLTVMQFMLVLCIVGQRASCGTVPSDAMATGHTSKGETLYIGRDNWQGSMTPGKVDPSHGKEISLKQSVLADTWVAVKNDNLQFLHMVYAGTDSDKDAIFVGRANHEKDVLPANVIATKGSAFVTYNGREYMKTSFEVLVGDGYSWSAGHFNGNVPPNAVKGGLTGNGETLYIGRASHAGSFIIGKVHPSQKGLYFPLNGQELITNGYEVLVRSNN